ncbi:MAG: tetratricopeptide repeat protein, partial [Planctomycetota bacterium]
MNEPGTGGRIGLSSPRHAPASRPAPRRGSFLPTAALVALFLFGAFPSRAAADLLDAAAEREAAGDPAGAATAYAAVLARDPESRKAALGLARVAIAGKLAGHFPAAEKALEGLHEAASEDVEVRAALGRVPLARSEVATSPALEKAAAARARAHLVAVVAACPGDWTAARDLARAAQAAGAGEAALAALDAWMARRPHEGAAA